MDSTSPPRYLLIANPRTASNLLIRMLNISNQQNLISSDNLSGYYFMPIIERIRELGIELSPPAEWSDDQVMQVKEKYQECFRNLQSLLKKAEATQCSVFVKEHAIFLTMLKTADSHSRFGSWTAVSLETWSNVSSSQSSNPTFLPDEFMRTWIPTFLIRHPALAFPSFYRAMKDNKTAPELTDEATRLDGFWKQRFTLQGMRALYNWYIQSPADRAQSPHSEDINTQWPVVMDADDIMTEPKLVQKYAQLVGMDPSLVTHTWEATSEDLKLRISPSFRRMLDTLLASKGIDMGKVAGNVDLDEESSKWRQEFGETAGKVLGIFVMGAIPDYEYLKARRLRA
ncbi:hypothetical protein N7495_004876 [Penicillium taxi]|uniref:uncharacterized protein n=1 Tax=Penicillium taxi TaxID=168475 RepID=UPI00254572F2|nr:uncharacterized protein N7495_004876 [Penicillium taxi]KAJ5900132.1 hypothetical protein N7495_004876 [Penicillium taxi]